MTDGLFSIDLQAAVAKLAKGRLRNPHQLALALCRGLAAQGPESLAISLGRHSLELEQLGAPLDARTLHRLHRLLDPSRPGTERLVALEEVESAGELDLLTAFAVGAERVELDAGLPTGLRLVFGAGSCTLRRSSRLSGTDLRLRAVPGLRPKAVARELAEHLRWASYPVLLKGKRISKGLELDGQVHQIPLRRDGHRASLGLPRQGRAQRIIRLRHGVLEEESWYRARHGMILDMVCDGPGLEVEEALRWAQSGLPDLLADARAKYEGFSLQDRQDLVRMLLRMVDEGGRPEALLADLRLFPLLQGGALNLQQLRQAAVGRVIRAVEPGALPGDYLLDAGPILVLDSPGRDFLHKKTGLVIRAPVRRVRQGAGLLGAMGESLRSIWHRLRKSLSARKPIPEAELDEGERRFSAAIEDLYAQGWTARGKAEVKVSYVRGSLSPWRWEGEDRLLLSRRHPRLRRLLRAFEGRRESLYAAALLFEDGADVFGPERRAAAREILGLTWSEPGTTMPEIED